MKQTFIVGVETDKTDFNDWIEEHDEQIRANERAKTLIEIIDFIKYECCLEDRITKVLDKAEELKEQNNE